MITCEIIDSRLFFNVRSQENDTRSTNLVIVCTW